VRARYCESLAAARGDTVDIADATILPSCDIIA